MKTHKIPLESFAPKRKSDAKIENGEFHMPAEIKSNGKERRYAYIPEKYKIPFRIDMTVKLNFITDPPSQFICNIGEGNVYFNGGYTICADILTGEKTLPNSIYYNDIPSKEYVYISIIYESVD